MSSFNKKYIKKGYSSKYFKGVNGQGLKSCKCRRSLREVDDTSSSSNSGHISSVNKESRRKNRAAKILENIILDFYRNKKFISEKLANNGRRRRSKMRNSSSESSSSIGEDNGFESNSSSLLLLANNGKSRRSKIRDSSSESLSSNEDCNGYKTNSSSLTDVETVSKDCCKSGETSQDSRIVDIQKSGRNHGNLDFSQSCTSSSVPASWILERLRTYGKNNKKKLDESRITNSQKKNIGKHHLVDSSSSYSSNSNSSCKIKTRTKNPVKWRASSVSAGSLRNKNRRTGKNKKIKTEATKSKGSQKSVLIWDKFYELLDALNGTVLVAFQPLLFMFQVETRLSAERKSKMDKVKKKNIQREKGKNKDKRKQKEKLNYTKLWKSLKEKEKNKNEKKLKK